MNTVTAPFFDQAVARLEAAEMPDAERVQRLGVVRAALDWLGTPYHPHARVKGAGCDCATLLAEVYEAASVRERVVLGYYSPQWHLHQDEDLYLQRLGGYAHRAPESHAPLPGDIALFQFGRSPSHGAIVLDWPLVIHAYIGKGVVIEEVDKSPLIIAKNRELSEGRFHSLWTLWS